MYKKYQKGRPFLIITYSFKPAEQQHTSKKDWGKTAVWNSNEKITIEDKIKPKHLASAHAIIDIINKSIIKNRFEDENDKVIEHFLKKYNNKIEKALIIWRDKLSKNN